MSRPDPHSYCDDAQPRIAHAELVLRVDFSARVLDGTATLRLARPAVKEPLDLDTRDLIIESIADQAGAPISFESAPPDKVLGSRLRLNLPDGTRAVTIRYRTSPTATALQWLSAAQTAGRVHPYLFSQCQAIHARSMVPLQDTPRVRITFHAELTVPAALKAVMAAAPAGSRPAGGDMTTFSFDMPQPIPSYLLALAVGDIASKDLSPRSRVYAEPQVLDAAAHDFGEVEAMMQAAEKLFGPYPWERFDMLVMPPSFPYGGMENPRLTFLTPTLLAGDRSLANVVVHELSHSWTGNLVTNATLEDFWLNEGFTVYAERRLLEVLEGVDAAALHGGISWSGLDQDLSRLGRDSPLTALCTRLEGIDPDEVYSQVPYEKGCLFLTRIEQAVGRDAFDEFLRAYLARFRFTSITAKDFYACLVEQLPGIEQKVDLHQWMHLPGLPADVPRAKSTRLDELEAMVGAFGDGKRPALDELKRLSVNDWQVLLPKLSAALNQETALWLDEQFRLSTSRNMEVRVGFLTAALKAGHDGVLGSVEDTLKSVGRMKYLRPLFSALKDRPGTLAAAKRIFDEAKDGYHPVARHVMAGLLGMPAA